MDRRPEPESETVFLHHDFHRPRRDPGAGRRSVRPYHTRCDRVPHVWLPICVSPTSISSRFPCRHRVNWILSPKMSLQVYMQPLVSVGDYWDFKEFARPDTFSFLRYGSDIGNISLSESSRYTVDPDIDGPAAPFSFHDPDFNFKSLRVNAIFRWEWKLGSTLYFVWTQNRQDHSNPGRFSARTRPLQAFHSPRRQHPAGPACLLAKPVNARRRGGAADTGFDGREPCVLMVLDLPWQPPLPAAKKAPEF